MKGWSSITILATEQSKQINKLKEEKRSLISQLSNANQKILLLNDQITQLQNCLKEASKIKEKKYCNVLTYVEKNYKFLFEHLIKLYEKSEQGDIHGIRYSENLKAYYFYMTQIGEFYYKTFMHLFGLPSIRTLQRFKSDIIQKFGLNKHFLDASAESVELLINLYSQNNMSGNVGILAIDAASVTASIAVSKEGEVKGLINSYKMTTEFSALMKKSISVFSSFVESNKEEIIKYYFVGYFCPLSITGSPFPILLQKSISGAANSSIVATFEDLIIRMNDFSYLKIIGISFDGDPGWLKYVYQLIAKIPLLRENPLIVDKRVSGRHLYSNPESNNYITQQDQLDKPLHELVEFDGLLPFEDLLHLMKCARYKILSKVAYSWPNHQSIITQNDMVEVGIPLYVLNDSKSKKMEDLFPLLMFNMKVVNMIFQKEKYHMLPYFLPFSLLLESIFTEKISRGKRLKYITISFSLIWILSYEISDSKESKYSCPFDKVFCDKYLSLCISFSILISKNTDIHLGALGTHFLEHFFGKIRRLCKFDDSYSKFEASVQISIIIQILKKYYGLEFKENSQKSRLSDSGAKIFKENLFNKSMQYSVKRGMQLSYQIIGIIHSIHYSHINNLFISNTGMSSQLIINELELSDISYIKNKHEKLSTLSYKMQGGGGYTGIKRVQSGYELGTEERLNDLINDQRNNFLIYNE